jgi:hypothetical protein
MHGRQRANPTYFKGDYPTFLNVALHFHERQPMMDVLAAEMALVN